MQNLIISIIVLLVCEVFGLVSFSHPHSVWFDSSRVGLIVGFVAWFANFLPFMILQPMYQDLPL